jgi:sugar/nucleoside kinase (ribokinase family)
MPGAWRRVAPDILILGQITVDDIVPVTPGPWRRELGGNALYAAAGARLWCMPERIGIIARVPTGLPFDVHQMVQKAGFNTDGLVPVDTDPLIEWIVYEEDGNRQSLPRNASLRDPAADVQELFDRYLQHLESLSASCEDIPREWLPAKAIHLAPQVLGRHAHSCRALVNQTNFLSVDPSPHYSRSREAVELAELLAGATAFLPSQAEVQHLAGAYPDWPSAALALRRAGFAEVVLKQGSAGALLATAENNSVVSLPAAKANPVDLTGAGDAFSGAYAASRSLGHSPLDAGVRAAVAAAMIIECSGTLEAFSLLPQDAEIRLRQYLDK